MDAHSTNNMVLASAAAPVDAEARQESNTKTTSTTTFDATGALSSMFLWVIFGFLMAIVNCDLQRFLQTHPWLLHVLGLTAFVFLFALLDPNNKASVSAVWAKAVFVYALFLLMTKAKWYFVLPVLALLLADQTWKRHVAFQKAAGVDMGRTEEKQEQFTRAVNVMIPVLITLGTLHYMTLQYVEYGQAFSFRKFFFGATRCKRMAPDYSRLFARRRRGRA